VGEVLIQRDGLRIEQRWQVLDERIEGSRLKSQRAGRAADLGRDRVRIQGGLLDAAPRPAPMRPADLARERKLTWL